MNAEEQEVLELLKLQDSAELLTLREVQEELREQGVPISPRKLTYYVTEGVVPKSLRIGARAGAYPRKIVDLLAFVSWAKDAGFSLEAIKKLRPRWMYMEHVHLTKTLDLRRLQEFASNIGTEQDRLLFTAIVDFALRNCPDCQDRLVGINEIIRKDGRKEQINHEEGVELPFGRLGEDGNVKPFRILQLKYPTITEEKLIVFGGEPKEGYEVLNARLTRKNKRTKRPQAQVIEIKKEGDASATVASA